MNIVFLNVFSTSFPGLTCEDDRREEKALIWAQGVEKYNCVLEYISKTH